MIEQQSILHIIEKQRNYHSCIITTFSFDFYYFENNLLRRLSTAGIQNVTLLVDEHMLEQTIGKNTAFIRQLGKRYSIAAMPSKGAFHPKLIMLFGEHQGLLIVGSGNTTFAGHSKNFEVWGVFHFDTKTPEKNNMIWSASWQYISTITKSIKGINATKIQWIKRYSPWINNLPISQTEFSSIDKKDKEKAIFLHDTMSVSMLGFLKQEIDNQLVKKIVIVAPFFDKNGKTLERIHETFPNAKIKVVLQSKSGTLPLKMANIPQVAFYDWEKVNRLTTKSEERQRKLHGKLIHFELENSTEYLLIGSANISKAALGTTTQNGINQEAGILLKHENKDKKYLKILGLEFKNVAAQPLSDFEESDWDIYDKDTLKSQSERRIYIRNAERTSNEIELLLNTSLLQANDKIKCFSKHNMHLATCEIKIKNEQKAVVELDKNKSAADILFIQIYNAEEDIFVSNKCLVQDVLQAMKSNPDPVRANFDKWIQKVEEGNDDVIGELLKHIIVDDFSLKPKTPKSANASTSKTASVSTEIPISAEKQDYETFTKNSVANRYQGFSFENSNIARVSDFLHMASKQFFVFQEENDDEETITDTDKDEGSTTEFIVQRYSKSKIAGIRNFIKKIKKYLYQKYLDDNYQLTIKDLVALNICLYIFIAFRGRTVAVLKEAEDQNIIPINEESDLGISYFCLNVVGMFLYMANRNEWNIGEDKIIQDRFQQEKQRAFWHIVFCLYNTDWKAKQLIFRDNIYSNAMLTLLGEDYEILSENHEKEILKRENLAAFNQFDTEEFLSTVKYSIREFKNLFKSIEKEEFMPVSEMKERQLVYIPKRGIGQLRFINKEQKTAMFEAIGFRDKKSKNLTMLNQNSISIEEAIRF